MKDVVFELDYEKWLEFGRVEMGVSGSVGKYMIRDLEVEKFGVYREKCLGGIRCVRVDRQIGVLEKEFQLEVEGFVGLQS